MRTNIYMDRNGRTAYTKEEIAMALADLNSCEVGDIHGQGAVVTYFIHLDDNGNILKNLDGEEECFIRTITCDEFGLTEDEWDSLEILSFLWDHEVLECEAFADSVDDLTSNVNEWLWAKKHFGQLKED